METNKDINDNISGVTGTTQSIQQTLEITLAPTTWIDDEVDEMIMKNLCTVCNIDMGDNNPRQLCGKTRCLHTINSRQGHDDEKSNDYGEDDDNDEIPPKKKQKTAHTSSFLTIENFMEEVRKPTKWIDLDRTKIFRVTDIEEVELEQNENGTKRIAKVGVFEDSDGVEIKVWLPGVLSRELSRIKIEEVDVYIRSLGPKIAKKSGNTYQNFEIVKRCKQTLDN